jgi:uncharacterized membrane protein YfcA
MRSPLKTAAPLAVMVSITIAAVIVAQDWRKVHVRSAVWLLLSTLLGLPFGLMLLTSVHQQIVKLILALVIVFFAVYSMNRTHLHLREDSKAWLFSCGFFAGVMGGAFGMNGPPLAVYGIMRGWSPQHFRATLQGYFLPASLLGLAGYLSRGLWTHELAHYYLIALPVVIPAILLGRKANHRLAVNHFRKYVYSGLIVIGVVLAFETLCL